MALFQSGNPVLSEKTFNNLPAFTGDPSSQMTIRGTLNKFGFAALMLVAGALFAWKSFYDNAGYAESLLWIGLIGGFILALVITFKKTLAPMLVPAYAVLEGLFLGAISAMYNNFFEAKMPNIITNAVGLTIGTVIAMYLLFHFRIIQATKRFKAIVFTATAAILVFYIITMVINMFGIPVPMMYDSSPLGIGISFLIVGIAAMNLIVKFDMIEQGAAQGAPKYMEWYSAFGLMVTIVWLYLEILRLLSRFASRN